MTKPQRRPMTDAQLIAALERKPYDRASREAARRLRELTNTHLPKPSDAPVH